jgi:hypothetical protein
VGTVKETGDGSLSPFSEYSWNREYRHLPDAWEDHHMGSGSFSSPDSVVAKRLPPASSNLGLKIL